MTVIKRFSPEDVFGHEMSYPEGRKMAQCPNFEDGQEIIIETIYADPPEEFKCSWAWNDLFKDLSVLSCGGDFRHTDPKITYTTCRDGMKPVVFKLERIEL
ncbi:MAG: TIGR04076 family protein [Candidatus Hermodarchaeota archaeon]